MSNFNVETVRSKFPALGEDQIFFDNAGGSQTLGTVIEA
jgi:selenocysteine lyase/cysteine desulfurase